MLRNGLLRNGPLRFIIIVVLLAAALAGYLIWQEAEPAGEKEETRMTIRLTPDMESVKVTWRPVDGTDLYVLYRADVTDAVRGDEDMPKRTEYQSLGDQGSNTSFTDVGAEENHFYSYIVESYDTAGILIGDSYRKDEMEYVCVGMGMPTILNYGYGEEHTNSKDELFLYMMAEENGVSPEGAKFQIYRTVEGKDKYRKIGTAKAVEGAAEYRDSSVKPGTTYTYRVVEVKDVDGESRESEWSDEETIPAVNFTAKYRGMLLKKESKDNVVAFKLRNADKYNGITTVYPEDGKIDDLQLHLTEYSMDRVSWEPIPEDGLELPAKKAVYLKGTITGPLKESYSQITSDGMMLDYEGPGNGNTAFTLDLKTHDGEAYMEWD